MKGIIDVHSHILPGLDDGASDMNESIEMLRQAQRQGICGVIATPHYSGRYPNMCPERIRSLCREVQMAAEEKLQADIRIWPGQEILYTEDAVSLLEEGKILTIADSRYVLTEFLPAAPYSYIFRGVKGLVLSGYRPVLAHAERYQALREAGRLEELKDQGALVQLNFGSAGGKWYHGITRWCRKVLLEETADLLGTDMHDTGERGPDADKAAGWLERSLSDGYAERLLSGNAMKILEDKEL